MKRIFQFLFFLILPFAYAQAQQLQIKGRVLEDSTNTPLSGVSILVAETKRGSSTDKDGNFSINVSGRTSATLLISSVGYRSQTITTNGRETISILMQKEQGALEDVVVIGYSTVRRRDVTGAVSSVGAKQLRDIPITNAAEALTGRLAGVQVTTSEGAPGADVTIRVRGGGSITQDNSPIYIVDGVQVENALQFISPQDIASVDVLKDASTTAIYGARGANGVVIITTKGGRVGKTQITYNGSVGFREIFKKMDVFKPYEFVTWQYERYLLGNDTGTFKRIYGSTWDTLQNYKNVPFLDWQEDVFGRKAGYQNHNFGISGGSSNTTFNLSLTSSKEQGILLESGFNRNLANFKLDHKATDKFRVGFNVRFTDQTISGAGTSGSGTRTTNRLRHAIQFRPLNLPTAPPIDQFDEEYFQLSAGISNPILLIKQEYRRAYTTAFNVSGYASYQLRKDLSFKTTAGFDNNDQRTNLFWGTITGTARNYNNQPVARVSTNNSQTINISNVLQFTKKEIFPKHDFDVLLGQETYERRFRNNNTEVRFLPTEISAEKAFARLSLGAPPAGSTFQQPNPTSYISAPNRIFSLFGRMNYTYADKLTGTFTLRSDRSSKFAYENGALVFPSGTIAWRFSKEKFMENVGFINDAKLRLGYGVAGNNRIDDFEFLQLYNPNAGQYALNHAIQPGYAPAGLANLGLRWEKNISQNIGLDLSFLKNKIQLTVDAYKNQGEDLLLQVAIPATTGYTVQTQNLGSTSNSGIEFQVNATPLSNKNFTWSSNFNLSFNRNKVKSLGPVTELERNSGWQGSDGANDYLVKVGEPVGLMFGFVTDGFYKIEEFDYNATTGAYTLKTGIPNNTFISGPVRPGTMKIKDLNGDGIISVDGDRKILGNANPDFTGGWSNQITYKNFDFSVFVNWVVGNDIYNANKIEWTDGSFPNLNLLGEMRDRFRNIDDMGNRVTDPKELAALNANAKIWSPNNANRFFLTDYAIEDGSFLRVNNITIGYTIPKNLMQRIKVSNARLYATVNNLATLTNYSGFDPEVNTRRPGSGGDPLTPGVDFAGYPRAKTWVFGVNITF
ncbi:MAG: TonB-dependent receptor [Segetibacter sp.]|nr:TonB-dependent receptor [Segetibacter sp.]